MIVVAKLLYVLHVLGAVFWVGGMGFALLALRPSLAEVLPPSQRLPLLATVMRRFSLIVWHAMPVLVMTGYGLVFGVFGGFAGSGWHVHVMHGLGLAMAGIYIALFFGPLQALKSAAAAGEGGPAIAAAKRVGQLVAVNFGLGLATVAVAAWGRFGI